MPSSLRTDCRTWLITFPELCFASYGGDGVQAAGQHKPADAASGGGLGNVVGAQHIGGQQLFPGGRGSGTAAR